MENHRCAGQPTLKTVQRAFDVLELMSVSRPMTASEISSRSNLARAAVCRILSTLQKRGYIKRELGSTKYRVTEGVLKLVNGYDLYGVLAHAASPILASVARRIIWPLAVSRLRGQNLEVVLSTDFDNPFSISKVASGSLIAANKSASGRVIVGHMNPEHQEQYLRLLAPSFCEDVTDAEEFKADAKLAFANGYSFYQDCRLREKTMAIPVKFNGDVVAALECRFISTALPESDAIKEVLPALKSASDELSCRLPNLKYTSAGLSSDLVSVVA